MSTGDINNGPYAERAKEYVWSTMRNCFPRGITPTDIDALVEINRCFFVFEGKTTGAKIDKGQGRCLKEALMSWPVRHSVAVVCEHPSLDRVDVSRQITRMTFGWRSGGALQWSPWMDGHIAPLVTLFCRDAEAGELRPETWEAEILDMTRPFGDAA